MPMSHKAYAFDWRAFMGDELPCLLSVALRSDDTFGLITYIERNRHALKDPSEGDPLGWDWQRLLENHDVHDYGDFALTRFYNPADDRGLSSRWNEIDEVVSDKGRQALLGFPFGYGSYFQTPAQVTGSLALVCAMDLPWLDDHDMRFLEQFRGLLRECAEGDLGLYVTF